tara:strand:+ start:92 stop:352 length:261 start_codon:yes stop_codon:yes gene_type:complete
MSQHQYEILHIDDDPLEAVRFDTQTEARLCMELSSGYYVEKTSLGWKLNHVDDSETAAVYYKTKTLAYNHMEYRSGYCIYKVKREV